jgi:hypothetical protein
MWCDVGVYRFAVEVEQRTLDRLSAAASGQSLTNTARERLEQAAKRLSAHQAKVSKTRHVGPEVGPTSALFSCISTGMHGANLHLSGQPDTPLAASDERQIDIVYL